MEIGESIIHEIKKVNGFFKMTIIGVIMKARVFCFLFLSLICSTSMALEVIDGKITRLEASYMPTSISFMMNVGSASCPAGKWLKWQTASQENNKAVYSTLLTALASGKTVSFLMKDGDTNCLGQFLHILN